MKKQLYRSHTSRICIRLTSSTWAVCLLSPLPIIARECTNRFIFHSLLFAAGWLSWAYTEYFFHRFIMHESNTQKGIGKLLNHSHHHRDPQDIRVNNFHRLIMLATCMAAIILSAVYKNYTTLFCGYIIGFTIYAHMHVLLHYKWSEKIFPGLHQFHIVHHCKNPDKCFGVVITWWDHLFGTAFLSKPHLQDKIKNFYYKKSSSGKKHTLHSLCNN